MYSMNTNEVQIIDQGYKITVLNKKTGQQASAKNHCGYVNHKMDFTLSYPGKPHGEAVIVSGRPEALSECLRLVGLPSYRTLKRHEVSVNNESDYIPCEYVSSWEGFGDVSSPAKYDPVNNTVYDVESADLPDNELAECEILAGEFMILSGVRFALGERSPDDTWPVEEPNPLCVISGVPDLRPVAPLTSQIQSASARAAEVQSNSSKKTNDIEPKI